MKKSCTQCTSPFEVTNTDLAFYEKISPVFNEKRYSIPPPTLCPDCRQQRRFAFRNERSLYKRDCYLTGKPIISVYSPDKPYTVYEPDAWWGDKWDPMSFGRDFDFEKPFFHQFSKLLRAVPKLSLMIMNSENCDFTSYTINYRDSYMVMSGFEGENIYYGFWVNQSRDCTDCSVMVKSELCYECTDGFELYHCIKCHTCENCSDCTLCFDCKGCTNCTGCVGLRQKEYCYLNEQLSQKEYEDKIRLLGNGNRTAYAQLEAEVVGLKVRKAHLYAILTNSQNSTGHFTYNSKNAHQCFDCMELEDCAHCTNILYAKDCYDSHYFPRSELMYEVISSNESSRQRFCYTSWESHDLLYCHECMRCRDCFGCAGLKSKQYCIFNKQYTKEQYEELAPRIISHMQVSGSWGEFFPIAISLFGYNESIAQHYYPLTKGQAENKEWKWYSAEDTVLDTEKVIPAEKLPESIDDIPDDILNWAIVCKKTGNPFKITKQELEFYRRMLLPVPQFHPEERYRRRMAMRNPRKLWGRNCAKCSKEMQTTYSPERKEAVYCEECYLKEVY